MIMTAASVSIAGRKWGKLNNPGDKVRAREIKFVHVTTDVTDGGATFDVTLADYNLKNVLGIRGITHTTTGSVLVVEAPTTVVSSGVLTITVGGSTAQKLRSFLIFGEVLN